MDRKLTKKHIELISRTIGNIKSPNYEKLLNVLKGKEEFEDITLDTTDLKNIHKIINNYDTAEEAAADILNNEDSSLEYIANNINEISSNKPVSNKTYNQTNSSNPTIHESMKIKDYVIKSSKTQAGLCEEVMNAMKFGWVPLGGVSSAAFGMSPVAGNQYIQAMVKYE
ncbi:hypothetical protein J2T55_000196 [Methylohalomonas lacus]|uniref:Uncharacterized protein n=1 Tax=Methylohalomonas lacus TaxID=398773 RepID=A0AAE3HJJ3_9GAMM|nr:DUF1737 domain-containing protein [Methylohalomonas lacus]MCS3902204.1 hypothetical protein [Methylohalomonas lacus]